MQSDWGLYESWRKSFQHKHADVLRNYVPQKIPTCNWIQPGEEIFVHDILLKKGFFYIGEFFEIPKSYKRKKSGCNIDNTYNREYKLSRIFGPVIQEKLPIERGLLEVRPFSSYYEMTPTHRYEYLMWLAGEKNISEISSSTFLFYLYGLQLRMFIDDSTDDEERLDIIVYTLTLYSQCLAYKVHTSYMYELELFINASICYYFKGKEIEIFNHGISQYCEIYGKESNLIYEICCSIVKEQKKYIPEELITSYFVNQVKQFVESEINKIINSSKTTTELSSFYSYYSLAHPSGILSDSLLCYDLLLNIRVREEYQLCSVIRDSIKSFSIDTYANLKDYRTLNSISPILSFFALPSTFNAYDYKGSDTYVKLLREKTESNEYVSISINDILAIDNNAMGMGEKIDKNQIISVIKCVKKIGYGIVPNFVVDQTRFNYGDICIIYREADTENIDITISRQLELLIKVCVTVIGTTLSGSDTELIDNKIKSEVSHVPTQKYLSAYLRWILLSSYKLTRTDRNDIQKLPNGIKKQYGIFATRIAIWNNLTIAKRIDNLKTILQLFNVDSHTIHTFIHHIMFDDEEFATIEKETQASEYTIGRITTTQKPSLSLNYGQLKRVEKQTKQAQEILSNIFQEDEKNIELPINNNNVIMDILSILLSKDSWRRSEIELICQERHLMIGFVLEQINDYSYGKIEDAVIEDDGDTIYVITEYKDKLI